MINREEILILKYLKKHTEVSDSDMRNELKYKMNDAVFNNSNQSLREKGYATSDRYIDITPIGVKVLKEHTNSSMRLVAQNSFGISMTLLGIILTIIGTWLTWKDHTKTDILENSLKQSEYNIYQLQLECKRQSDKIKELESKLPSNTPKSVPEKQ